jgi:penicillin-binding protein 2
MNPKTGEIISLISYPSYDNNIFIKEREKVKEILKNPYSPMFNRIVSGLYNPGSTIKPILAVGALEEKIIDPNKKILANGEIRIPNPYFPGKYSVFKDWKVHGWVDMREAIANSVNVYFYTIGGGYGDQIGLGVWRIKKYFELFGLGRKTGIDLLKEEAGYIGDPELKKKNIFDPIWRIGDTYNISIGQGEILVTPLQIALFTSALAENKIVVPYIVKKIYDQNGKIIYERKPIIVKENLVKPENLRIVQEGMRMTVTSGTAKILKDLKIEVAGKSGTPQILGKKKLNAIFTGYAPYQNPEIVMTLFIEEVPEGSVATLPLYKSLIELYFSK